MKTMEAQGENAGSVIPVDRAFISFIGTGKKEQAPKIKRRDSAQRTRPADESHIGPPAAS
jgi:hypothetical protein